MSKRVLVERFYETLIAGDRPAARHILDDCFSADIPAEQILEELFWPALEQLNKLFRNDQLSVIAHNYATRLLRMLTDQLQIRLTRKESRGCRILMFCGPNEPNELAGQMAADLLEADGYEMFFAGGGVAHDEIINQVGQLEPAILLLFSSTPSDLPQIRKLIDSLHDMGVCPDLQIVVGGGVFNRAEGLAEEIGADLAAQSPLDLVKTIDANPEQRTGTSLRTVGRRRRQARSA